MVRATTYAARQNRPLSGMLPITLPPYRGALIRLLCPMRHAVMPHTPCVLVFLPPRFLITGTRSARGLAEKEKTRGCGLHHRVLIPTPFSSCSRANMAARPTPSVQSSFVGSLAPSIIGGKRGSLFASRQLADACLWGDSGDRCFELDANRRRVVSTSRFLKGPKRK